MTIGQKAARKLRKLADLIDPRIGPSEVMTMRIEVDSCQAEDTIRRLSRLAAELSQYKVIGKAERDAESG
jgi:hypothetical protein